MTNAAAAKPARPVKKTGFVAETVEIIKTVVYALLIAFVLRVVLFQPYTIPSASDEPNLYRGDYIIVTKWSYGWSQKSVPFLDNMAPIFKGRLFFQAPQRGDIIVFKNPPTGQDYIKRLIGLPGDHIQMKAGHLFINDKPVTEITATVPATPTGIEDGSGKLGQTEVSPEGRRYLTQVYPENQKPDAGQPNANNTAVYTVPAHCYFMMGDNRDDSLDSRFDPELAGDDPKLGGCGSNNGLVSSGNPGVGFVPEDNLEGRARIVLLSWNTGADEGSPCCASIFKPWTWFTDLRPGRTFKVLN